MFVFRPPIPGRVRIIQISIPMSMSSCATAQIPGSSTAASTPLRILLVDPDPDARIIYRTLLQHHGHHVLEATYGREALDRAFWGRPHVVITSMHHPGLSGQQLIRTLRHDWRTADVRIIALTADPREETRESAYAAGCDTYLLKPLSPSMLLHVLE